MRIPKTGPVTVKLSYTKGSVEMWYNRDIRLWTVQELDADGNQVGPNVFGNTNEASYHHHRDDAVTEVMGIRSRDILNLHGF